jgi:hypothetical protein
LGALKPICLKEKTMKTPILVLVACASIALPFAAFGQSNDFDYCASLSKLFRIVVANGIPVLEKFLTDQKVSLPPRT